MPILNLTAKIGADGSGFKAGLKELGTAVNQFAGNLRGQLTAAFGVAGTAAFLKDLAETVSRIKDLADQYGITTDEVQRADVALHKNGLQFENLGRSIQKVGAARREAVEGNMTLRETFKKYGASLNDLRDPQVRNYDLILRIAEATRGQNLTAQEQIQLTDLLGDKSYKLLTTLQTLKEFEGIDIFSEFDIKVIDDANKKLDEMIRKLKILAASGIVEAQRNPAQVIGDYLEEVATMTGGPASLIIGKLLQKFGNKPVNAPPLEPLDVVRGNIEKSDRISAAKKKGKMFELDKDLKKHGGNLNFGGAGVTPGGFGAAGGFSAGFISGFDPKTFIEQSQLVELQKINDKLEAIKNKGSTGTDGAFTP